MSKPQHQSIGMPPSEKFHRPICSAFRFSISYAGKKFPGWLVTLKLERFLTTGISTVWQSALERGCLKRQIIFTWEQIQLSYTEIIDIELHINGVKNNFVERFFAISWSRWTTWMIVLIKQGRLGHVRRFNKFCRVLVPTVVLVPHGYFDILALV